MMAASDLHEFLDDTLPWVEKELLESIIRMRHHREVYKSWTEALDMASEDVRSYGMFHRWVQQNYVAFMVMAVRREGDTHRDSTSLRRFLITIQENAHLLGRDWYFERNQGDAPPLAAESLQFAASVDAQWSEIVTDDGQHVDSDKIEADINRLMQTIGKTRTWATKYVAHRDVRRKDAENPKYSEIHAAVDEIEKLWRKWHSVLTNISMGFLEPDPWESVLTMPWITQDQANELFLRRRAET
jgi:hypothetical protein